MNDNSLLQRIGRALLIPTLAIITSLIIGALIIIITAESPLIGLTKVGIGYWGIIDGALLSRNGIPNTLVATIPLILTGLAVAIPFHAGLFNIGAEGQFMMGALIGTLVGIYVPLPVGIHPLAVLLFGFIGGALWGLIPGLLRAYMGAHEVINTIMLNFIAIAIVNYAVRQPFKAENTSSVQTLPIQESAELFRLVGRLHVGIFVALILVALCYFFLFRTTWGFALRTTGHNPDAAHYAGINPKHQFVISMTLAGGLAGVAGVMEVQGLNHTLTESFNAGYGFDAIAVSLLALNNPIAIIPAAFIFAILRIGGDFLQIRANLSVHIVSILQALILLFVSAPMIIRYLYRLPKKAKKQDAPIARGWGG
ncbi:MAG TPA: ABC transporter permease [Anaerolineae bacterium]|nr:ABC transporter permease [Anaerolineae bacterium]